jgi:HK97 family phage major capsid protein
MKLTIAEQIKELKEQRAEKSKRMEEILARTEREGNRPFTDTESTEFKEFRTITQKLELAEEREKQALNGLGTVHTGGDPGFVSSADNSEPSKESTIQIFKRAKKDTARPLTDWYLRNHDVSERMQKANVYSVLGALATNKTHDTATTHALDEIRTTTGTGLLNEYLSTQLWSGGLSKSRLARAGMRTFPMESGTHKMAKVTTYPSFEWKAALASTTERTAVFDNVTFTAKTLRGYLNVGGELLQDGMNIDRALKRVMDQSAANAIDTAGLIGAGGDAPTGISGYSALNTYSNGGAALTSFDPLLEVTKLILDDDGDVPTAAIMSPRHWKQFNALKEATTNAPLHRPFAMDDLAFYDTSKVQGASAVFMGGFENLYMGIRFGIDVAVSPVIASTFSYDYFMCFRGDFKPEREQDFGAITGIA